MRTHYCGDVDETLNNQSVSLCGWVHHRRDLGGLIFINLRDREGIVQIVCHPEKKELFQIAEKIKNEFVLNIKGKVQLRPSGQHNQKMKTGAVEVIAEEIIILSESEPVPFAIENYVPINEETRLKYRYLDLRRPEVAKNLIFRSKLSATVRSFLNHHGFVDIETPILTKATPEGARDYLVPSRVHPGKFYALPQSPQLFKQLLMMSGFDRYYQIVKCFRDEDLRADRQPEFTQIDIEFTFSDEKTIQSVIENMIRELFKTLLNVDLPPFPVLTYQEAMQKYGVDKPDLRNPLVLMDVTDIAKKSSFIAFVEISKNAESRIVSLCIPNAADLSRKQLDDYTEFVKSLGLKGLAYIKVNDINQGLSGLQSPILKFFNEAILFELLKHCQAKNGDLIFLGMGPCDVVHEVFGSLRLKVGKDRGLNNQAWAPCWVVDFPMFEFSDGRWYAKHHPFTAPKIQQLSELDHPKQCSARAYDLVINGTEIGGGSIRINQTSLQKAVFKTLGISNEEAEEKFGFLLEAMKYGCPPHGGIALGLDRLAMHMVGADSIRDVIAFPKTTAAACPLTDAPSTVSQEQLNELKIKSTLELKQ